MPASSGQTLQDRPVAILELADVAIAEAGGMSFRVLKKIENAHDDSVWTVAYGAGCFVSGSVDETVLTFDFPTRRSIAYSHACSFVAQSMGREGSDQTQVHVQRQ